MPLGLGSAGKASTVDVARVSEVAVGCVEGEEVTHGDLLTVG